MQTCAAEIAQTRPSNSGHLAEVASLTPRTPRWRVLGPLAEGGMGSVWSVEHVELGLRAALKTPHAHRRGRAESSARLRDEARALARIRHPGVPDVLDLGTLEDGRPYFVMERVQGGDLRAELTRHGVLSVPTAMRAIISLLDALEAVHGAGLVHRDVKLENLVLRDDGHLVLVDFGLALRVVDPLGRTGHGRAVGTPRSMSPEQHARGHVDHRADLYAAGLCLFELVAGRGPFDDAREQATHAGMYRAHCERTPPRLGDVAPQVVPPGLEEIARRALAKAPEDRFETAGDMRHALRAVDPRPQLASHGDAAFAETVVSVRPRPQALLELAFSSGRGSSGDESGRWEVGSSELMPL